MLSNVQIIHIHIQMVNVLEHAHRLILQTLLKINVTFFAQGLNLQIQQLECALIYVLMVIMVKILMMLMLGKGVLQSAQILMSMEIL